ncbi:MAG: iron ABC transporter permease [Fimbriimonadaceae bacterium]
MPVSNLLSDLLRWDASSSAVLFRFPRALGCVLAGATLGATGSALQALFRNPIADPYVCGVSSGAAAGGAAAIFFGFGTEMGGAGTALAGLVGGAIAISLVVSFARRDRVVSTESLLLSGVMIGSIFSALLSLVLLAAGQDTNKILGWLLGSMTPAQTSKNMMIGAGLLIGGTMLLSVSKQLNILALGEESASRLGINSGRIRFIVLAAATIMVSITVGTVGIIGFLGLASPHIARRLVGVDWRQSLLASAFVGAVLLSVADILAQKVIPNGGEVPVGILTAVLGAPFLLALIRKA